MKLSRRNFLIGTSAMTGALVVQPITGLLHAKPISLITDPSKADIPIEQLMMSFTVPTRGEFYTGLLPIARAIALRIKNENDGPRRIYLFEREGQLRVDCPDDVDVLIEFNGPLEAAVPDLKASMNGKLPRLDEIPWLRRDDNER
jgi:hypothetical protein